MPSHHWGLLRSRLDSENLERLAAIDNPRLHAFVADAVELCEPDVVWVSTDSPEDIIPRTSFKNHVGNSLEIKKLGKKHPGRSASDDNSIPHDSHNYG